MPPSAAILALRSVLLQPNMSVRLNTTNPQGWQTHKIYKPQWSRVRPSCVSKREFTSPIFTVNILGCRYECESPGFLSPFQWSVRTWREVKYTGVFIWAEGAVSEVLLFYFCTLANRNFKSKVTHWYAFSGNTARYSLPSPSSNSNS